MKKTHIVALILIAVCFTVIVGSVFSYSTNETFASAMEQQGETFNLRGFLAEDMPFSYDPLKDPNHFEFYMKDEDGAVKKVIYSSPMPQDFERSEELTITGKMQGDEFYASKILMKCPSKYVEDEIMIVEANARQN